MTNRELYFKYKNEADKNYEDAALRIALAEANGFHNFSSLISEFDNNCKNEELLSEFIKKLKEGVPIQYAVGKTQFLDFYFKVNENVLIPRPETEQLTLLTSEIIENVYKDNITICDIGTGSGCIAISLKKKHPNCKVFATDISKNALDLAKENAKLNDADITFLLGDMEEPLIKNDIKVDILVSNPPYIEDENEIEKIVFNNEPHLALIAKPCTLYYEKLIKNAKKIMKPNSMMVFEIGENMEEDLKGILGDYLDACTFIFKKDIYNKTRFLFVIFEEQNGKGK